MGNATFARATGKRPQRVSLGRRQVSGTITLSGSYATSGDTLVMTTLPFDHVTDMVIEGGAAATDTDGYQIKLGGTVTAPKVIAYNTSGQVSAATDLSGVSVQVRIVGY
jgi:hypothetical protein